MKGKNMLNIYGCVLVGCLFLIAAYIAAGKDEAPKDDLKNQVEILVGKVDALSVRAGNIEKKIETVKTQSVPDVSAVGVDEKVKTAVAESMGELTRTVRHLDTEIGLLKTKHQTITVKIAHDSEPIKVTPVKTATPPIPIVPAPVKGKGKDSLLQKAEVTK